MLPLNNKRGKQKAMKTDLEKALDEFDKKAKKIDVLYENLLGFCIEVKAVKDLANETRKLADSLVQK